MEQNKCLSSFELPQEPSYYVAIIGLGGAAGRIVNKLQKCNIPDTRLFAFDMNWQEIDTLLIMDKFIAGDDGLEIGKDRSIAMSACQALPVIEKILSVPVMAVFVVCLGGVAGENCMEMFLRRKSHSHLEIKFLIATLPHYLEGIRKRENAKKLIEKMKPYVDGIIIIDYGELEATSIVSLYAKADKIIEDTVESFVGLLNSNACFDFCDIQYFLRAAKTKIVDFVSINNRENELKNINKLLPAKYSSAEDIEAMILELCMAKGCKEDKIKEGQDFFSKILQTISTNRVICTWSTKPNIVDYDFKLNLFFTKK